MGTVNGSVVKRAMLRMAINSKMAELSKGIMRKNSIWDTLIFRKIQEGMGGRLRLIVAGSAPLSGQVLTFMRCALGCVVRSEFFCKKLTLLIYVSTFKGRGRIWSN